MISLYLLIRKSIFKINWCFYRQNRIKYY
jgi:hypothetical protein